MRVNFLCCVLREVKRWHLVNILVCSVSWLDIAWCIIACLDGGCVVSGALATSTRSLATTSPLGKDTRQQGEGWGGKGLGEEAFECVRVSGRNIYGKRGGWDYDHEEGVRSLAPWPTRWASQ